MTMINIDNPFSVTRAVDFSDQQILKHWVDLPGEGGVHALAKPRSQMPMIILGGKGSGKTHLIRFLSTAVQLAGGKSKDEVLDSKYLGIYLRCGGINSARFEGKGQTLDAWDGTFHYYVDLILAELCLDTARRVLDANDMTSEQESAIVHQIVNIFNQWVRPVPASLEQLCNAIAEIRRNVDMDVNNCALRRTLETTIDANPSELVFGVPKALRNNVPRLADTLFVYLIDELENLKERQQKYINSLVRENQPPCSFKVGTRLYGLRTLATLSADEELKEGSEYERVPLDEGFRKISDHEYDNFVIDLCLQRLRIAGIRVPPNSNEAVNWFKRQFEDDETTQFGDGEVRFVLDEPTRSRPWMVRLEKHLQSAAKLGIVKCETADIKNIMRIISVPLHPVVERTNIHQLYQNWGPSKQLIAIAQDIAGAAKAFVEGATGNDFAAAFKHWKFDMIAQIYRDFQRPLRYVGLDTLIRLSHGLPRHLLILLKHVYGWSVFRSEDPFKSGIISLEAQRRGVKEAAEWFFQDARMAGPDGNRIRETVSRIAELMRAIRYSDKPTEVSLCTISLPFDEIKAEAQRILSMAEKWSLLSKVDGGRPNKNSFRVDAKYQLNPLLAPRWDLPISRRGDLSLNVTEADTLLLESRESFEELLKNKTAGMMGPRFSARKEGGTLSLFGDGDA